jgi:hypothetical protein
VSDPLVVGTPSTVGPRTGTCEPWATTADLCSPCNGYDLDTLNAEDWLQVASDILFDLTGRTWAGFCEDTVRPCRSESLCPPVRRGASCGCPRVSEIALGGFPLVSVNTVRIDGEVVDPARYRIDDHRTLVYLPADGDTRRGWPRCQDLTLDASEEGTFEVVYTYGMHPPVGGTRHAATLACELMKTCDDTLRKTCRLPERVTSVTMQGTTVAMLDPLSLFEDGRTGLGEVDMWVASVRLGRRRRPPAVLIPGRGRRVRRTGT